MQVQKGKAAGSSRLARIGVEFSREARVRLAWMDFYRASQNVARTCRHFGISRQTFYRWQRRYDALDLSSWNRAAIVPRRRRQPTWSFTLEEKVLTLRLQFPRWGKDKLAVLLRRQKLPVSASMVGRILTQLKRQGRLVEPPRTGGSGIAPGAAAPSLCRAQTQAVRGFAARRSGRSRYSGRASGARRDLQTVHRPRRDLPLGRANLLHPLLLMVFVSVCRSYGRAVDFDSVSVAEGSTILGAAKKLGIDTPTLCSLESLTPVNVCRVCVVELEGISPFPGCLGTMGCGVGGL